MTGGPIIIRIPVQKGLVRIQGVDREVLRMKGLWHAEYDDGDLQAFTNPLKEWMISQDNFTAIAPSCDSLPELYFVLEPYSPGDFTIDPQLTLGQAQSGQNSVTDDDFQL